MIEKMHNEMTNQNCIFFFFFFLFTTYYLVFLTTRLDQHAGCGQLSTSNTVPVQCEPMHSSHNIKLFTELVHC